MNDDSQSYSKTCSAPKLGPTSFFDDPFSSSEASPQKETEFPSYLIIGSGRVARHFAHYFRLLEVPFVQWARRTASSEGELKSKIAGASHILLLISDTAIASFEQEHELRKSGKTILHFSGSLVIDGIIGAHPLMTFTDALYDLPTYQTIPFIVDAAQVSNEILPMLTNRIYALDPAQKAYYHALCAMSGNFTVMLWEKVFSAFETQLRLPKQVLLPYLQQTTRNLVQAETGNTVLTGPLSRGDAATVERHLDALHGDPYQTVYRAFAAAYQKGTP
jgi:predicted short-subunit dehydrogenase-like oxidoreductase (DUF2520 family)